MQKQLGNWWNPYKKKIIFFQNSLASSFHSTTDLLDLKFVLATLEYFKKKIQTFMILITSWTWFEDVIWVINLFLRLSYDHLFQHSPFRRTSAHSRELCQIKLFYDLFNLNEYFSQIVYFFKLNFDTKY